MADDGPFDASRSLTWRGPFLTDVSIENKYKELSRADSRFAPSEWETVLLYNDVSNWLGVNLGSALLCMCEYERGNYKKPKGPLSNIVWMAVTWFVIWFMHPIFKVKPAWWVLMDWRLFATRLLQQPFWRRPVVAHQEHPDVMVCLFS